jgi:hypothetical protein
LACSVTRRFVSSGSRGAKKNCLRCLQAGSPRFLRP